MRRFPPAIQELLAHLNRLPGVGPKTAKRYLFHLLREPTYELKNFAALLEKVPSGLKTCMRCGDYSENQLCDICSDHRRDKTRLCVIAASEELGAIESTAEFRGNYHILGGTLSPLEGITPDKLRINDLLQRIKQEKIEEVILALNPDIEGEATILYLGKLLAPLGVKITRLARGLPMGSDLQYADEITLTDAIRGRRGIGV